MTCKVCLSLMVADNDNVVELMPRIAKKSPDLLEFRLDELTDKSKLVEIAHHKRCPAIATVRGNREDAEKMLLEAVSSGFEFVDLDLSTSDARIMKEMKSAGAEVLVSFHDQGRTPPASELKSILASETKAGADICKIVTTANSQDDNLNILNFLKEKPASTKVVSFAMGQEGIPSRILSPVFGAEFTFASLTDASKTADGQLTIDDLRSAWHLLGIH